MPKLCFEGCIRMLCPSDANRAIEVIVEQTELCLKVIARSVWVCLYSVCGNYIKMLCL